MSPNDNGRDRRQAWGLFALVLALLLVLLIAGPRESPEPVADIAYSELKTLVAEDAVAEVVLKGEQAEGRLRAPRPLGPDELDAQRFRTRIPAFGDPTLLPSLEEKGVRVQVRPREDGGGWGTALLALGPWVLIIGIYVWFIRRMSRNLPGGLGGRGELKGILKPPTHKARVPDLGFDNVAGQENAKREVSELVDYLRDPERFRRLGAEVPRGVLLMGPPGTGKTLLARALAGEAKVPFFTISASEFIEIFVGVGASRVRKLFETAKESAPSIIFIDELDSVGRTRGTGLGGGHDEREQTLNQILAEMDGFEGHEAVIVLAATNRPDVLDPALLRPGRFDRHVVLDLPDKSEREAILRLHTRKVPLGPDVDLGQIAAGTPGFSGADLKNLVNEAAIAAARDEVQRVAMEHLDEARDKLMMGTARTLSIQPDERHRLAVHEAGHTVAAYHLPLTDPLYKVTILPRGRALGGTHLVPEVERHTLPEDYLKDRLALTLGGRASEKLLLGTVSSGADDDIAKATALARSMVARWGMAEEVGPLDLSEAQEHPFLGREIAQPRRFSEHSAQAVDEAVRGLILEAEERATDILRQHRPELERLVETLEREETLHRERIEDCLRPAPGSVAGGAG
jgi:cell division protease FtsH